MGDLLSSGIKTATQTDTVCSAFKMFKMRVYVPVIVTSVFRAVPFSNILEVISPLHISVHQVLALLALSNISKQYDEC